MSDREVYVEIQTLGNSARVAAVDAATDFGQGPGQRLDIWFGDRDAGVLRPVVVE